MIIGFGNNVVSSLAADITASQTTIQVMPGAGAMFANLLTSDYANSSNPLKTYAKITLTDAKETVFEVCHLTTVNNDMLTVIRGQEGTTAKGWSLNDVIANFATRGSENQFVQIEELQSGHYVAGVAGGTENNLTLELPATYFVNGGADWTLRTPLVVIPALNNTGASTLQLTMGGRVLGIFPLYKGNKAELSANDIIKDAPVLCVLDNTKTYFSVLNPLEIYLGSRYLQKDQNLSDVPDKAKGRSSLEVYSKTESDENYMAKSQCGADIPNKPLFLQNVGLTETVEQARNAVPSTRKVNGKALTTDITLTSGDIGALPVTGGKLNGPLGIGTDNALGGNSIVFGDNDTGFKQNGDGILDTFANSQHTVRVAPGEMMVLGAIRAGKEKKLSLTSNNNSTMTA
ncbi:phage tail protein, partial [Salmonella enterica subsp. enterica serovar Enteritidis]